MPTRRALLVPAVLTLALTVPAPPAQALPGCAGYYTILTTCQFTTLPYPSVIVVKATAATNGRGTQAWVAVGAYADATPTAVCGQSGYLVTECVSAGFVRGAATFTCRVAGFYAGSYSCMSVPASILIDP